MSELWKMDFILFFFFYFIFILFLFFYVSFIQN